MKPDVKKFLNNLNAASSGAALTSYLDYRESVKSVPIMDADIIHMAFEKDITVNGIKCRLYDRRESRAAGPILVYFHGGGFVGGGIESHGPICTAIADYLDIPVFLPEFRLAPEHPWPAQADDCEMISRWAASNPSELERDVTGLVLCGDSGGATLTIITAQALRDVPAQVPVILQAPICPLVDPEGDYPSRELYGQGGYYYTEEAGNFFKQFYKADFSSPRASPLLGKHHDMPPTVLATAELDLSIDSARAYAKALISEGNRVIYHECKGMIHGFAVFRRLLPSAKIYVDEILELMRTTLEL